MQCLIINVTGFIGELDFEVLLLEVLNNVVLTEEEVDNLFLDNIFFLCLAEALYED